MASWLDALNDFNNNKARQSLYHEELFLLSPSPSQLSEALKSQLSQSLWPCLTTLDVPAQQCIILLSVPQPYLTTLTVNDNDPSTSQGDWVKLLTLLAQRAAFSSMASSIFDSSYTRLKRARFFVTHTAKDLENHDLRNLIKGCWECEELYFTFADSSLGPLGFGFIGDKSDPALRDPDTNHRVLERIQLFSPLRPNLRRIM